MRSHGKNRGQQRVSKNKFQSAFGDLNKEITVVYPCPDEIFSSRVSEPELKK